MSRPSCVTQLSHSPGEARTGPARLLFWNSTLAPDSFWSGLIDDVRVYDQAVTP